MFTEYFSVLAKACQTSDSLFKHADASLAGQEEALSSEEILSAARLMPKYRRGLRLSYSSERAAAARCSSICAYHELCCLLRSGMNWRAAGRLMGIAQGTASGVKCTLMWNSRHRLYKRWKSRRIRLETKTWIDYQMFALVLWVSFRYTGIKLGGQGI